MLKSELNLTAFLEEHRCRINDFLKAVLPSIDQSPQQLHQAMHYAALNGGKRIRPLLVYATGEALGLRTELLDYPAAAVELMHAYSLVHDDLPAMDNDDLRRGLPTCHKAFDEATAILVGDALQTLAFDVLSRQSNRLDADTRLQMIQCLAGAVGSLGMAGGQALDLEATGKKLDSADLYHIHHLKTGALICACIQLAALAAKTDKATYYALSIYAKNIGLCFQIQDDILNAQGSLLSLGKAVGTDELRQKATFVTMEGLKKAKESLQFFHQTALHALTSLNKNSYLLQALADYIVKRDC